VVVDKEKLKANVQDCLNKQEQVTLAEVLAAHPLELGLAELLGYMVLASKEQAADFGEEKLERIVFARDGRKLQAVCQQITFRRGAGQF
jgi:translation elongation factor EF-1beta